MTKKVCGFSLKRTLFFMLPSKHCMQQCAMMEDEHALCKKYKKKNRWVCAYCGQGVGVGEKNRVSAHVIFVDSFALPWPCPGLALFCPGLSCPCISSMLPVV